MNTSKTMFKLATGHGQVGDGVLVCAYTHCLFAYYNIGAGSRGGGGGGRAGGTPRPPRQFGGTTGK